ncbi:ribose-phosphate diphosphokinase [Schaalia turicensis]|uniref:ribose-phosphate diphosphokinase n=1 Tax=Schaalia turicensis TaxID=131111 RepID=UPI00189AE04D|nr:ribose-phosphate diphosphokinase [Schaalia turicensis]
MSGLVTSGEKSLVLVSGRAHLELAEEVGKEIGCGLSQVTAYDFASGEIYVRFNESVRGADVFVLQSHTGDINKWLMEQLIMIDAAKRASAKRITAVSPFYPYSRQDKKHQGREPISARLISDLYKTAGADRVMSVDLHASQEQGFFDGPVDHLFAMPVLVDYVRSRLDLSNTVMVSPDAGRIRVAEKWSSKLGGCPLAFVHKTRDTTRPNVAMANRVVGEVAGKECVLVDDMIDTAGTITEAVKVLNNAGAKKVIIAATHGILSDPATRRLSECGATEVVVTDTLPIPPEKRFPTLTILSIAPLLARAIREVFDDGSVTSLFD